MEKDDWLESGHNKCSSVFMTADCIPVNKPHNCSLSRSAACIIIIWWYFVLLDVSLTTCLYHIVDAALSLPSPNHFWKEQTSNCFLE